MARRFVYELPYSVRKSLCRILDATDKWEELGGAYMGFDYTYLQYIRRKDSPTDELLTTWGNQNHTVIDLFVLLSKMQHYRAMREFSHLVPDNYHHLMRDGEELMIPPPICERPAKPSPLPSTPPVQVDSVRVLQAVARPTFEDNKDLGFDKHNLNVAVHKSDIEEASKAVKEVKIQNIPKLKYQNIDENSNSGNNPSPEVHQAACNPTLSPPPDNSQPRTQERKLSNVSVTSSVMEGFTPAIEYEELEAATDGWDPARILGRGGFGTVYRGTWKNTLVAIKKLDAEKQQQLQNSDDKGQMSQGMRELRYLNSHRHDNILSLYGYSLTDTTSCLVYQYMANGSLEDRLLCRQNTRPLSWAHRLNIMTGTARGIQFLHSLGKKPLVHGDIKSANILLDSNLEPRLGDFGLAREAAPLQQYTHVKVSKVHGTRPYLPDEFLRAKQFSVKVDTYSFGVVLFEVVTGLRAYDQHRKEKFLKDHVLSFPEEQLCGLGDLQAGPDYCSSAAGLLRLGCHCVKTRPRDRPDMKAVLHDVDTLLNSYKEAERVTCLARQRSLTPTTPLEMQVAHDERRLSPLRPAPAHQLSMLPHNPFMFPVALSPETPHYVQGHGAVQVLPVAMTGMPRPIIIHHPPSQGLSAIPQAEEQTYHSAKRLDSSMLPQFSVLGVKPDVEDEMPKPRTPTETSDLELSIVNSVVSSELALEDKPLSAVDSTSAAVTTEPPADVSTTTPAVVTSAPQDYVVTSTTPAATVGTNMPQQDSSYLPAITDILSDR